MVGLPSGSALQIGMRSAGLDLLKRIAVEGTLIGAGAVGIWAKPPGSALRAENWGWCMCCLFVSVTGAVAMAEGAIIVSIERLGWLSALLVVLSVLLWTRQGSSRAF